MRTTFTELAQSFLNTHSVEGGRGEKHIECNPSPPALWEREVFNNNTLLLPTNPVAPLFHNRFKTCWGTICGPDFQLLLDMKKQYFIST